MWNTICGWFAKHYVPADNQTKLADALFDWKHR